MGCGMSKTNLPGDAFGKRKASSKLLIKDKSQSPELQKIKTNANNNNGGGRNSNVDSTGFGSPSFREYVKCSPHSATTDNQQGEKETVICKHGDLKLTCNEEVCRWEHSGEDTEQTHKKETKVGRFRKVFQGCRREHSGEDKEQTHKEETKVGRFRKVFQVHKVTFWPGRPWQIGHRKATKKTA